MDAPASLALDAGLPPSPPPPSRAACADGAAGRTGLGEVRLRDVGHRLPERVGRLGVAEVALEVVVADAIVGAEFFGVAVASAARTFGGHRVPSS